MSVRAYRQLTSPDLAQEATFNLWHNTEVVERLEELPSTAIMSTSEYEITHMEVSVEEVEELLKDCTFPKDIIEALRNDVDESVLAGEDFIFYTCF